MRRRFQSGEGDIEHENESYGVLRILGWFLKMSKNIRYFHSNLVLSK